MSATYYGGASPLVRTRSVSPMSPGMDKLMPSIADHTVGRHMGSQSARGLGHARTYYNSAR